MPTSCLIPPGALVCVLALVWAFPAFAQPQYPGTAAVLREALKGELSAHSKYLAYARKAKEEKYPGLAKFAAALSVSEGIHARNFQTVLAELGATTDLAVADFPVADTRGNLRSASSAEIDEIDSRYPRYLARLEPEGYAPAIDALTHAWLAEKQHRDMIGKILAGSTSFFGLVVKAFEDTPRDYLVCQNCGSTLVPADLPKDKCPICAFPAAQYKKIEADG